MSDGGHSKLGNTYEEDCVLLEFLRLLNGENEELVWERKHPEGKGLDFDISKRNPGRESTCIGIQCKKRDRREWSASTLRGVVATARDRLRPSGNTDEFRFMTSARAPNVEDVCTRARASETAESWWSSLDTEGLATVASLGLATDAENGREHAWQTLRRFRIVVQDRVALASGIDSLAKALGNPALSNAIRALRVSLGLEVFNRTWTAVRLRKELGKAGVEVPDADSANEQLDQCRRQFLALVSSSRGIHPKYERIESRQLHDEVIRLANVEQPAVVLVHGPAGCGKSEVLAQAIASLEPTMHRLAIVRPTAEPPLDPIATLRATGLGPCPTLFIDQLDEMFLPGYGRDKIQYVVFDWMRRALDARFIIVLACRTVDIESDTRLTTFLRAHGVAIDSSATTALATIRLIRMTVGDLTEAQAAELVATKGVPWASLSERSRRLLRRPVALRLYLDSSAAHGAPATETTLSEIVERWTEMCTPSGGSPSREELWSIAVQADNAGSDGIPRAFLGVAPTVIDNLLASGLLVQGTRPGTVRFFHQVVAETLVAQSWARLGSVLEVLNRLKNKRLQDLRSARKLRLAIPLMAIRGQDGVELVEQLLTSNDLRPLVRHSALLGLAVVDLPQASDGTRSIVSMVSEWLRVPERRNLILQTVVAGQVQWTLALADTLDEIWKEGPEEQRRSVIRTLASVSTREGRFVAERLQAFKATGPDPMPMAEEIFWSDASEDSEELFEWRLDAVSRGTMPLAKGNDWNKLSKANPRRANILLAHIVRRMTVEELRGRDKFGHFRAWHPRNLDIRQAADEGREAWVAFGDWWKSSQAEIPARSWDPQAIDTRENSVICGVVEWLAATGAATVSRGEVEFDALLPQRESPRIQDRWLVLRIAHWLAEFPTKPEIWESIAEWILSRPESLQLRLAGQDSDSRFPGRDAVASITQHGPKLVVERLQRVILDSGRRMSLHAYEWARTNNLSPAERRPTGYEGDLLPLLSEIPPDKRLPEVNRKLAELERRFPRSAGSRRMGSGLTHLSTLVPQSLRESKDPQHWIRWIHGPRHEVRGTDALEAAAHTLRAMAEAEPSVGALFIHAFALADPAVPAKFLEYLIDGICLAFQSLSPEDCGNGPRDREQIVHSVLRIPKLLERPEIMRPVAWLVRLIPSAARTDEVLECLVRGAANPDEGPASASTEGQEILSHRLKSTRGSALDALQSLAQSWPDCRERLLQVAGALATGEDISVRAGAALLALAAAVSHLEEATRVVLTATEVPRVGLEPMVHRGLLFLLDQSSLRASVRKDIESRLLAAVGVAKEHEDAVRAALGVLRLRYCEFINDAELRLCLESRMEVRKGAAEVAMLLLFDGVRCQWLQELAIALSNDPEPPVGDVVGECFGNHATLKLLGDVELAKKLLATKGVRRSREQLAMIFPRVDVLGPLAEPLLDAIRDCHDAAAAEGRNPWAEAELRRLLLRIAEEPGLAPKARSQALDLLDEWLEAELPFAGAQLAAATSP